jgi:hypothetical protein
MRGNEVKGSQKGHLHGKGKGTGTDKDTLQRPDQWARPTK